MTVLNSKFCFKQKEVYIITINCTLFNALYRVYMYNILCTLLLYTLVSVKGCQKIFDLHYYIHQCLSKSNEYLLVLFYTILLHEAVSENPFEHCSRWPKIVHTRSIMHQEYHCTTIFQYVNGTR